MSCGSTRLPHTVHLSPSDAIRIPAPFAGAGPVIMLLLRLYERQQQRRMLRELDDRMLADMGITREQAEAEARKPFWQ